MKPQTQQHTPGPWRLYDALTIVDPEKCNEYGEPLVIAKIMPHTKDPYLQTANGQEAEANARLIAAAPEMLSVLEWVKSEIEYKHDMAASLAVIEQTIAKAIGR